MKIQDLPALRKYFGTRWLARRGFYALNLRSGSFRRRMPAQKWTDPAMSKGLPADAEKFLEERRKRGPRFFFSSTQRETYRPLLLHWDDETRRSVTQAEGIARGVFRLFEHEDRPLGFPPNWHTNPITGARSPTDCHWSEISDFKFGDIKTIWEPSRFGFAYPLVRAYWRSGHERFAESFWLLVEDWREHNQPQQGANWKCGQEAAFRAMAWCFGLYGFLEAEATTANRVLQLTQMLGFTAHRIEANIDYAISQANNHGISEALGLWTIGTLFPEFAQARKWRELGRSVLETEGRKLIYEDGAFAQHSMNYHRLVLHDYVWALRLGELQEEPFSEELQMRVRRAGEFLLQLQDETTGALPNYGHNDSALILPLNNCEHHDYRPVIAATQFLSAGTKPFAPGPWDEDLLWLFGRNSLAAPVESPTRADFRADRGGYYTLRSAKSFVFARCANFRHRPGQADMLHVDLWWRGENIALDPGTYGYNASEPWGDSFAGAAMHNTVTVDGRDQMERAGRFLWLPWLESRLHCSQRTGAFAYLEGEHDGYQRLTHPVTCRRGVLDLGDDLWLVLDDLKSAREHDYRLHWLVADLPNEYEENLRRLSISAREGECVIQCGVLTGSAECSLVRADETSARGWRAPFYGCREPALSLALRQRARATKFWTLFSSRPYAIDVEENTVQIRCDSSSIHVELATDSSNTLIRSIRGAGEELTVAE